MPETLSVAYFIPPKKRNLRLSRTSSTSFVSMNISAMTSLSQHLTAPTRSASSPSKRMMLAPGTPASTMPDERTVTDAVTASPSSTPSASTSSLKGTTISPARISPSSVKVTAARTLPSATIFPLSARADVTTASASASSTASTSPASSSPVTETPTVFDATSDGTATLSTVL